ncbi:unnamed protein product [Spirodela intermedia]|uniref:Uncharacterized protein n=2 Tax=Spirodela intermedia TaxID=51605 RepID=A0A7I8JMP6_SPIIN|nr:unnamed protein product [Spirodela intermedia]CAA6671426.1 unnamed protein product [Spirodela intermedia]CAA7408522.1 unnamed protein product [Spirodela intermedia]
MENTLDTQSRQPLRSINPTYQLLSQVLLAKKFEH